MHRYITYLWYDDDPFSQLHLLKISEQDIITPLSICHKPTDGKTSWQPQRCLVLQWKSWRTGLWYSSSQDGVMSSVNCRNVRKKEHSRNLAGAKPKTMTLSFRKGVRSTRQWLQTFRGAQRCCSSHVKDCFMGNLSTLPSCCRYKYFRVCKHMSRWYVTIHIYSQETWSCDSWRFWTSTLAHSLKMSLHMYGKKGHQQDLNWGKMGKENGASVIVSDSFTQMTS